MNIFNYSVEGETIIDDIVNYEDLEEKIYIGGIYDERK